MNQTLITVGKLALSLGVVAAAWRWGVSKVVSYFSATYKAATNELPHIQAASEKTVDLLTAQNTKLDVLSGKFDVLIGVIEKKL